jgi:hypothetical protein
LKLSTNSTTFVDGGGGGGGGGFSLVGEVAIGSVFDVTVVGVGEEATDGVLLWDNSTDCNARILRRFLTKLQYEQQTLQYRKRNASAIVEPILVRHNNIKGIPKIA